jgi:hypothetical protein
MCSEHNFMFSGSCINSQYSSHNDMVNGLMILPLFVREINKYFTLMRREGLRLQ